MLCASDRALFDVIPSTSTVLAALHTKRSRTMDARRGAVCANASRRGSSPSMARLKAGNKHLSSLASFPRFRLGSIGVYSYHVALSTASICLNIFGFPLFLGTYRTLLCRVSELDAEQLECVGGAPPRDGASTEPP